jgi:uncharacterized protein (DUF1778 family)
MTTRRLPGEERRDAVLGLRITQSEKEMLSQEASAAGLSLTEFVYRRLLGNPPASDHRACCKKVQRMQRILLSLVEEFDDKKAS